MSPADLDRRPQTPMYQQIAGYYAELIRSGTIKPGDQLPSVVRLCDTWKIAQGTAVNAIKVLRSAGLVQTSRRGTYACQAK